MRKITQEELNLMFYNDQLDLTDTFCYGLDFRKMKKNSGIFVNAFLQRCNFSGVNCILSDFSGANLEFAIFDNADCSFSKFSNANLFNARFVDTDCSDSNFTNANLSYCTFVNTKFGRVDFSGSNLEHSRFIGADFLWTMFYNVKLGSTLFAGSDFEDARGIYIFGPIGFTGEIGVAVKHTDKVLFQFIAFDSIFGTRKEVMESVKEHYYKSDYGSIEEQLKLAERILQEQ